MKRNAPIVTWQGQVVWVVGASSGIGQALAHALHGLGANVVVSARRAAQLQSFADEHPGALPLPCDVTDAASVQAAFEQLLAHHGHVHTVVYAAGTYAPMRADTFDLPTALSHQAINYQGALHVVGAVLPQLREQGFGHLSLISSVAGFRGLPQALAYGPTKAALTHLAEILALDSQDAPWDVSVVHPGFVKTPLTAQNPFEMPALMTTEAAVAAMLEGWRRGRFDIHFPRRLSVPLKLMRCLPWRVYVPLVRRFTGL